MKIRIQNLSPLAIDRLLLKEHKQKAKARKIKSNKPKKVLTR